MIYEVRFGKVGTGKVINLFSDLNQAKNYVMAEISKLKNVYYIRTTEDENCIWYDFGSYVDFYSITFETKKEDFF